MTACEYCALLRVLISHPSCLTPQITDEGLKFLVPDSSYENFRVGCPKLKKVFLHGTSVTDQGFRKLLYKKKGGNPLQVVGVSNLASRDLVLYMQGTGLQVDASALLMRDPPFWAWVLSTFSCFHPSPGSYE